MPSFKNIVAIIAALSASTLATDVYAGFYDSSGGMLGPGYDTANEGCFDITGAETITFSQYGNSGQAGGPFCLYSYTNSACSGTAAATQQFENVNLDSSTMYAINSNVSPGPGFEWRVAACPT